MATSGSYDFTVSRDTIIEQALRKVGALGDTEPLDDAKKAIAAEALNLMVKTLMPLGMQVWCQDEQFVPMSAFSASPAIEVGNGYTFDLDYKPLKLLEAQRYDNVDATNPSSVPLHVMTNREWQQTTRKKETGAPISVYYRPEVDKGWLHLWPMPDSYWQTNGFVEVIFLRQLQDFDESTNTPDFPSEWHEALVYQLAVRLAPNYGLPPLERQQLKKEADEILGLVASFDQEEGALYITVDWS